MYILETPVEAKFYLPLAEGKAFFTLNGDKQDVGSYQNIDGCAVIKLEKGKYTVEY